MLYRVHLAMKRLELTLVVIGTDCTCHDHDGPQIYWLNLCDSIGFFDASNEVVLKYNVCRVDTEMELTYVA